MSVSDEQRRIAARFDVEPFPTTPDSKVGVAIEVVSAGLLPLNALRHPSDIGTSGWFVWAGEKNPEEESVDFFQPLHASHLGDYCPELEPYLALPPGWRVLLAPGYEDVWFDETLLLI